MVVPSDASNAVLDAAADFCQLWKQSTRHEIDFDTNSSGRINVWIGNSHLPEDLSLLIEGDNPGEDLCIVRTYTPAPRYAARGATRQLLLAGDGELLRLTVRAFFRELLDVTWAAPGVTLHPRARYTIPVTSVKIRPSFGLREVDPRLYLMEDTPPDQARDYRMGVGLPMDALPVPPPPLNLPAQGTAAPNAPEWGSEEAAIVLAGRIAALANGEERDRYQWPPGKGDWSLSLIQPGFILSEQEGDKPQRFAELMIKTAGNTARRLGKEAMKEPWRIRVELPEGVTQVILPEDTPVDRLVLQVVPVTLDFFRPLHDRNVEENTRFRTALREWRVAGVRVQVILPISGRRYPELGFPNLSAMGSMLITLHEEGVEGVYLGYPWSSVSGLPALGRWKAYLGALLAFDCGLDPDELSRRFCKAYYGESAASAVLQIMRAVEAEFRASGKALTLDDDGSWLSDTVRDRILREISSVMAHAGPAEAARLEELRQCFPDNVKKE
ncbi:MAG TPA: hypothetical protein PLO53_01395 [Candidatus Hydrogenedentes bacterium]|nr:hypothetical protein [Candidatus Hydrogenedentota bacterium]